MEPTRATVSRRALLGAGATCVLLGAAGLAASVSAADAAAGLEPRHRQPRTYQGLPAR